MRILYLDLDSMRPDHLGCYGYARNTSPNIDAIAATGVRFTDCYCSDAPCLPSRTALFSGRFGIHTGVVGHGGTAADLPPEVQKNGNFLILEDHREFLDQELFVFARSMDQTGEVLIGNYALLGTPVITPEPATMSLLCIGGLTLLCRRRRRRCK